MEIEWVNHSGFIVNAEGVRLLVDPWFDGFAFDRSWALIAPTVLKPDDCGNITHIWLSHEHPDHFSPPSLRSIPPEQRARIHLLYQPTKDKRVVKFCENLGFRSVSETPAGWFPLEPGVELLCQPHGNGDSWLAVRSGGKCLLNLNDCIFTHSEELAAIAAMVGPVDVLVTQFSVASWWGNPDDSKAWEVAAYSQLTKIEAEIRELSPATCLLGASYVYFCHEENASLNRYVNTPALAYAHVLHRTTSEPLILYPGDRWLVGSAKESFAAIQKYGDCIKVALADPVQIRTESVDFESLQRTARQFVLTLKKLNSRLLLWRVRPVIIQLTDLDIACCLSLKGLFVSLRTDEVDVYLTSAAFEYCLKFPFGGETLFVNSRFRVGPRDGAWQRFMRWFSIAQSNDRGVLFDWHYYAPKLAGWLRSLLRVER